MHLQMLGKDKHKTTKRIKNEEKIQGRAMIVIDCYAEGKIFAGYTKYDLLGKPELTEEMTKMVSRLPDDEPFKTDDLGGYNKEEDFRVLYMERSELVDMMEARDCFNFIIGS